MSCAASNYVCSMPISYNNLNNASPPWKVNDNFLDWYGTQYGQSTEAESTALDWSTDVWPAVYGPLKTVENDDYGQEPPNPWGPHHLMLDVDADMDCSKTVNGWFELKAYVKNGQGWEGDIQQSNSPYNSNNHYAQCGKINKFSFNTSDVEITNF